jgi:hypothetical protein
MEVIMTKRLKLTAVFLLGFLALGSMAGFISNAYAYMGG